MYINKFLITVLVLLLSGILGCQQNQSQSKVKSGTKVLAKVNGTQITAEDLNFRPDTGHGKTDNRTRSVDDVINQELFYQQGLKLKLDKDPSYQRFIENAKGQSPAAKRSEMARRVFNTQIASKIEIRLSDAKEYYNLNSGRIATALHLYLIKTDDRQKADDALKQIRNGTPYEAVAKTLMGDVPNNQGKPWDQGFLIWDKIPVDFVEEIYALKPGEVSGVLGSQQAGFQIIKLVEYKKVKMEKFEEVQAVVMNRLRDQKMLEAFNQYVADLRKNANIEKY